MQLGTALAPTLRYVGYDTKTGKIVQTHSRFSVAENRYVEIPANELKSRFSQDPLIVAQLTGQDPKNLDFIPVESSSAHAGPMMVDPAQRKLIARPVLRLMAKKSQLTGDGTDSTEIEIATVDAHGKPHSHGSGKVKVSTSRGKLSARGGIVELDKGHAKLTLTSVPETVERVQLVVTALDQPYLSGRLDIEFI